MQDRGWNILILVFVYLIGSISGARLVAKLFKLPDPTTTGSKNPGATNILRLGGKLPGLITFIFDAGKGYIVLICCKKFFATQPVWLVSGCFAVLLGHCYSIFSAFQGGKGFATLLGIYLGYHGLRAVVLLIAWAVVVLLTKVSALGAFMVLLLGPGLNICLQQNLIINMAFVVMSLLVVLRHKENFYRLYKGQEQKINL